MNQNNNSKIVFIFVFGFVYSIISAVLMLFETIMLMGLGIPIKGLLLIFNIIWLISVVFFFFVSPFVILTYGKDEKLKEAVAGVFAI